MEKTIFQRIIEKEIPAKVVYEDNEVIAFHDANPQAPIHVLIIPKKPIPRIAETSPEDQNLIGHLMLQAARIAKELGIQEDGYRLVINNGRNGGESVPHLHCHILGGRPLKWPPG